MKFLNWIYSNFFKHYILYYIYSSNHENSGRSKKAMWECVTARGLLFPELVAAITKLYVTNEFNDDPNLKFLMQDKMQEHLIHRIIGYKIILLNIYTQLCTISFLKRYKMMKESNKKDKEKNGRLQ